ncbi:MAG: glycosyltransferase [Thermoplasmata archaeon]|nr:glycosyltransferase [Thermoplasmata archaeon]
MEIAFFTDSYLPTHDGVAKETHALARAVQRLGHRVSVFTTQPAGPAVPREEEIDGIPVYRTRSLPVPFYGQYRWALFPFRKLRRRLAGRVDVVHLFSQGMMGNAGLLIGRRLHRPVLGTFNTDIYAMRASFPRTYPVRLFFRVARLWTLGLYFRCDLTTAPSEHARAALLAHARKPWRRPVEVVENGVELDRFHPGISQPDWRERCGLGPQPVVTFLSRLTSDKGVHTLLDAIERLPETPAFTAVIGGVGPEADSMRRRLLESPQLAGRVRYLGPIAEEEKPALLAQSDLLVLPSVSDTASIVLLEAMACGAACVASNIGGPAAILQDRLTGRLVPPRAAPLAEAIGELLGNPAERRRLAERGTSWVRSEASIERSARRFISLYHLLLTEREGRAARSTG